MIIERIPVGPLAANCYLVAEKAGSDAAAIDPGDEPDKIAAAAEGLNLSIVKILNTHGHWDHVGADAALAAATGAEIFIHKDDIDLLRDSRQNLSLFVGGEGKAVVPGGVLRDGEELQVGFLTVKVIHTPGHTRGGSSFLIGDNIFTGDLLFRGSVGRTDLPGGEEARLYRSIREQVLVLPETIVVYPGHGEPTTVGWEKRNNPYLI